MQLVVFNHPIALLVHAVATELLVQKWWISFYADFQMCWLNSYIEGRQLLSRCQSGLDCFLIFRQHEIWRFDIDVYLLERLIPLIHYLVTMLELLAAFRLFLELLLKLIVT